MTADAAHAWSPIDASRARSLSDARRQLHLAVQFGASFGISYLPPAPDDGHTNLGWDPRLGAFVSRAADTAAGFAGGCGAGLAGIAAVGSTMRRLA